VNPAPIELLATVLFGLAVLHTFCVKRFAHWAHQYPPGSVKENFLHFLAETEVVFGLWAAALFAGIAALKGSIHDAVVYIEDSISPSRNLSSSSWSWLPRVRWSRWPRNSSRWSRG
jgi:hypothetical protein